jgi:hypothetical protein
VLFFAAENFCPGPTFALLTARSDDPFFQEVRVSESWAAWPVDLRSCCAADAWARLFFPAVPILPPGGKSYNFSSAIAEVQLYYFVECAKRVICVERSCL